LFFRPRNRPFIALKTVGPSLFGIKITHRKRDFRSIRNRAIGYRLCGIGLILTVSPSIISKTAGGSRIDFQFTLLVTLALEQATHRKSASLIGSKSGILLAFLAVFFNRRRPRCPSCTCHYLATISRSL
jgi:hypothetical protein